jgi:hypothetical protein
MSKPKSKTTYALKNKISRANRHERRKQQREFLKGG